MDRHELNLKCQALTCACIDQDVPTLTRFLLDTAYKALIDYRGLGGNAPIHIAVLSKNVSILKLLLDAGADRNKRNIHGDMPMHCACRVGFLDGLKLLCSFRRLVTDATNDAGQIPLELAESTESDFLQPCDLYGVFSVKENKIDTSIIDLDGKKECASYLKQVLTRQRIDRMNDYFSETVELNRTKQKVTNILRDSNMGRSKMYYSNFIKPASGTVDCWSDLDYQIFERSRSLFNRMIISVSSTCLVSSVTATSIVAFNEKEAVEHQLWLYDRRKKEDTTAPVPGFSKNREFFKTPVAESGKRDDLPEYDYTSYDIDDIMSDEEAEYFEATDDMVTNMLLNALQATHVSTQGSFSTLSTALVRDILEKGVENCSRLIEADDWRSSFSEFSQKFVSSVVSTGLSCCLENRDNDSVKDFAENIFDEVISIGFNSDVTKIDDELMPRATIVADRFVTGIIDKVDTEHLDSNSLSLVTNFTKRVVTDILTQGISSFQYNNTIYRDPSTLRKQTALAEEYVAISLDRETDNDSLVQPNVISALAKTFVNKILEQTPHISQRPSSYGSDFCVKFVDHIISSAVKAIPSQDLPPLRQSNFSVKPETSVAESFMKSVISCGLEAYDGDSSPEEKSLYISDIVGFFSDSSAENADPANDRAAVSCAFVHDIIEAGLNQFSTIKSFSGAPLVHDDGVDNKSPEEAYSKITVLVKSITSQYITEGISRLAKRDAPMLKLPFKGDREYRSFIDSFTNNLFAQGLQKCTEKLSLENNTAAMSETFITTSSAK